MVEPVFKTRVARVANLLNQYKVHYVVVGGEAANFHGVVRATKDVDILLEKKQENIERALEALSHLTWGLAREILPEEVIKKPFTIIGDDPRVDLLLIAGKVRFDDVKDRLEYGVVEGVKIPFLDLESLIAAKQTGRAKDIGDLEVLENLFSKKKN